jgi:hypothetical protein
MYSFKDFVRANDPRMGDDEWLEYMRQKRKHSDLTGISTEDTDVDEALTTQARMKLKAAMRKNKAKIKRAKEIASKKKASKEKLDKRARKQAISAIKSKMLQGKDEKELSYSARQSLEKRVAKKKGAIDRLSKKLVKKVRKDEKERLASRGKS